MSYASFPRKRESGKIRAQRRVTKTGPGPEARWLDSRTAYSGDGCVSQFIYL